jgi:hypothetical protein
MVSCLRKDSFQNKRDRRRNGKHRNSRYDEGITNRTFPHEEGTEKSGQSDCCPARSVYTLDADPKRQEAQDVGIGSQENSCGTTETMGEIPSTASLKAHGSAIKLVMV